MRNNDVRSATTGFMQQIDYYELQFHSKLALIGGIFTNRCINNWNTIRYCYFPVISQLNIQLLIRFKNNFIYTASVAHNRVRMENVSKILVIRDYYFYVNLLTLKNVFISIFFLLNKVNITSSRYGDMLNLKWLALITLFMCLYMYYLCHTN